LCNYFLKKFTVKYDKRISISREVLGLLEGYAGPGNVRELENTIARTVGLAGSGRLPPRDSPMLGTRVGAPGGSGTGPAAPGDSAAEPPAPGIVTFGPMQGRSRERQPYDRVPLREKDLREAMHNAGGIQTHAARMLGVSLRQLRYALTRFDIKATEFKY